jgi:hypothetical protein
MRLLSTQKSQTPRRRRVRYVHRRDAPMDPPPRASAETAGALFGASRRPSVRRVRCFDRTAIGRAYDLPVRYLSFSMCSKLKRRGAAKLGFEGPKILRGLGAVLVSWRGLQVGVTLVLAPPHARGGPICGSCRASARVSNRAGRTPRVRRPYALVVLHGAGDAGAASSSTAGGPTAAVAALSAGGDGARAPARTPCRSLVRSVSTRRGACPCLQRPKESSWHHPQRPKRRRPRRRVRSSTSHALKAPSICARMLFSVTLLRLLSCPGQKSYKDMDARMCIRTREAVHSCRVGYSRDAITCVKNNGKSVWRR